MNRSSGQTRIVHDLPTETVRRLYDALTDYRIRMAEKRHAKARNALADKSTLTVLFFETHSSSWKRGKVYERMLADEFYEPIVVVIPWIKSGDSLMWAEMSRSYRFFRAQGYRVVSSFNKQTNMWLDVKKELEPDIVYFSIPYNHSTRPEYTMENFLDTLTVYSSYGVMCDYVPRTQYDLDFHNLVWKHFVETPFHQATAERFARNGGSNVVVSGYPFCDTLLHGSTCPTKKIWLTKREGAKKIIWAPHHTIGDFADDDGVVRSDGYDLSELAFSNFLTCHQFMLDIAAEYRDRIHIAFKPHPSLKPRLYTHPNWGKQRTDAYYMTWKHLENGQLEEGEYVDLFFSSDAMILDSVSFIVEYMFTGKPSLFMVRNESVLKLFNEFGLLALEALYRANDGQQVKRFIETIVLPGQDDRQVERERFLMAHFVPPYPASASDNIVDNITASIRQ